LDECVATGEDVGSGCVRESTHRIEPLFAVAMIPFEAIVQVLRGAVFCEWQDGPQGGYTLPYRWLPAPV
jgi:hypothetical protein